MVFFSSAGTGSMNEADEPNNLQPGTINLESEYARDLNDCTSIQQY